MPELPGLDSAERFSYGGFKLLFPRTGNTSSSLWAGAVGGTTIVLPDVDTFRLEFTRAID